MRTPLLLVVTALATSCASAPFRPDATLKDLPGTGVISDFDDTIAVTHVTSKLRMLCGVLFQRPEDAAAVPGAARAFERAADAGAAPFVYVSASPTFLEDRIRTFLSSHGLPAGQLLLKDWAQDGPFSPRVKAQRIEEILAAMPARSFVLVGDSGERDPEMYAAIRARHPDRISGIVIVATPSSDLSPDRFAGMQLIDDYAARSDVIATLIEPVPVLAPHSR